MLVFALIAMLGYLIFTTLRVVVSDIDFDEAALLWKDNRAISTLFLTIYSPVSPFFMTFND